MRVTKHEGHYSHLECLPDLLFIIATENANGFLVLMLGYSHPPDPPDGCLATANAKGEDGQDFRSAVVVHLHPQCIYSLMHSLMAGVAPKDYKM
jgi:hypothetical protein